MSIEQKKLKIVLPKGKLYTKVISILNEAGYGVEVNERVYVPRIKDRELEGKVLKAQNIPKLIELGAHDIGFSGLDWVIETESSVEEIMNLGFDPVRIVSAVAANFDEIQKSKKSIIIASEYEFLTKKYAAEQKIPYTFQRSYGATEVFPPQDADMIIDNTSSGRTLLEHNLTIKDVLLESATRFIANKDAMKNPWKREKIFEMMTLFKAILEGRERVMLEMNVSESILDSVVKILPCMRSPTISKLYNEDGFAIKVAIKKDSVGSLISVLKKMGATDILEYDLRKAIV